MMAPVRSWLLGMTCAAMVMALAESLIHEGRMRKICRLAGGLVMVLAAVSPILRLDLASLEGWPADLSAAGGEYAAALERGNDFLYETIIAEQTAAYISDKAAELGVDCTAEVAVAPDADGTPVPASAVLRGSWTNGQRQDLTDLLERDLGLAPDCIRFERTEP